MWRGADPGGAPVFALKAWPPDYPAARLRAVHARVARLSHLPFVPRVRATRDGDTVVEAGGRAWDVTAWAVGEPERGAPSAARVAAAAAALAAVHAAWRPAVPALAPCPGVQRRLQVLSEVNRAQARGRPSLGLRANHPNPPLEAAARRANDLVPPRVPAARAALQPWATRAVPLQTCLGDVWPDHVRFAGDHVAGLIDFGAVRADHVGADLARLFGGFPGPDPLPAALAAYRAAGGRFAEPDGFARLLADTGTLCAAAAWLVRLSAGEAPADPAAVAERLNNLLDRLV